MLIVFNRPELTRRVFDAVAAAKPTQLLLVADGPRRGREGEAALCEQVRSIVSSVDWPCHVEENFATENLGCRRRVISGLNWAFSLVDEAIILEDDCLPDASFFPFCSELLQRYRDCHQVGFIAGGNFLEESFYLDYSYYFTLITPIWGWATWRRSWRQYDERISTWPNVKEGKLLNHLFPNRRIVDYWTNIFDGMYRGIGPDTWDYQWTYTCWTRGWVNVFPARNLVQNIGFGEDATHTRRVDPITAIPARSLPFPLRHPPAITAWPEHAMEFQNRVYAPNIFRRAYRKLERALRGDRIKRSTQAPSILSQEAQMYKDTSE